MLLPTAPDSHIPDTFFERTGRDLKAEWQRVKTQRDEEQTLMTKAHREKLRMTGRKVHKYATVRVRFPEGVVLQGALLLLHYYTPVMGNFVGFSLCMIQKLYQKNMNCSI